MDLLQETIAKTRYARYLPTDNRREDWEESCWRYVNFFAERHPEALTPEVQAELANAMIDLEAVGSMRALMTAGEALRLNNVAGYNCAFTIVDRLAVFSETMFVLMSGTGMGYSVEREFVNKLPAVKRLSEEEVVLSSPHFVFEDSRLGWAEGFRDYIHALWEGYAPTYDLSRLRPKGALLKTFGGRSSGPKPLKELLDFVSKLVGAARGRQLTTLECHDIMCRVAEVVVCGGVRRSALICLSNLSDIRIRGCKTGLWTTGVDGQPVCSQPQRQLANNSVAYTSKPDIAAFMDEWKALYESRSGERGVFNREAARRQAAKFGDRDHNHSFGTNPCVTSDTWVLTSDGPQQVADLVDKPFTAVIHGKEYFCPTGFFSSGVKPTVQVETDRGYTLSCTPDHKLQLADGEWAEASTLLGKEVALQDHEGRSWGEGSPREFDLGWLVGLIVGDGGHNPEKYQSYARFWGPDAKASADAVSAIVYAHLDPPHQFKGASYNQANQTWQVMTKTLTELCTRFLHPASKEFKPELEEQSSTFTAGFLCGFFDTDGSPQGSVVKGRSVRLTQNSETKLLAVQRMLSRLGILSTLYRERSPAGERLLPDGNGGKACYKTKARHELVISRSDMWVFRSRVGLRDTTKATTLETLLNAGGRKPYRGKRTARVIKVLGGAVQEVYDCQVPGPHCFDANGLVAHNCGEIILRPNAKCNLSEAIIRAGDSIEAVKRKVSLAAIFGTLQASLTDFEFLSDEWRRNAEEEALLGVSLTGIMDHEFFGGRVARGARPRVLEELRAVVRLTNVEWAAKLGINPSKSWTCVKPSGTVSQLASTASGIHPRHAPFYLRRIRNSTTDPTSQALIDAGVPWEADLRDPENTVVFTFPTKAPVGATVAGDLSAIDQLEHWMLYRKHWATHTVSISVSVREHEWLDVAAWVYKNFDDVTGVSFFPYSDGKDENGNDYPQLPYQEVTEEEYETAQAAMPKAIDWSRMVEASDMTEGAQQLACVSGNCDI